MNQKIITAIEQKRVLRLQYKNFVRVVEPHAYGVDDKGAAKLRCYQTAGGRSSNSISNWKLLNLVDILALQVMDQIFEGARPRYKINDPAMVQIFAQLAHSRTAD